MLTDRSAMVASIARATGLTFHKSRVVENGAYNVVVEADDEWIFRFPRPGSPRDNAQERLRFLASFAKVSPLAVPDPIYVTDDFRRIQKDRRDAVISDADRSLA